MDSRSKDKIIVKKGKNYLASKYKDMDWLMWLATISVVFFVVVGVSAFISIPPGSSEDKYLEIDDAYQDFSRYYVVGNVYVWEPMISGGFHYDGHQMTIQISEFVYDQLEEGNIISLSIDSNGDYQYSGDIYGSYSSFLSVDDFVYSIWVICVFLAIYVSIVWSMIWLGKKGAEVIVVSNAEIIKKIRTWYGMYSYLKCSEGLFRLKDEHTYITCDVGVLLYTDESDDPSHIRLYALRENLKKIKNKSVELGKVIGEMESGVV